MTKSLALSPADRRFLEGVITAYLENRPFFYSFIRPQEALLFHRHHRYLKPPVLDFGAGDGFFASLAFTPDRLDYGLDLPNMGLNVPLAAKTYQNRITYAGAAVPLPDHSLNTVVSNCVFEHVSDIALSFKEIYRLLKPGGYFLASMLGAPWESYLRGGRWLGQPYLKWWRSLQVHRNVLTLTQWHRLYTGTGFKLVSTTGYLGPATARSLELAHYLAVPQLVLSRFGHRWDWPPYNLASVRTRLRASAVADLNTRPATASCYFIIARKPLNAPRP